MDQRRLVGPFEVIELLDASGHFPRPAVEAFPAATELDWARARRVDPAAFGPGGAWHLVFRCFAIRLPTGRFALVDAGVGPEGSPAAAWAPVPGRLPRALVEAGVGPAEVELVVLTHLHEDHVGWSVSPDGVPAFPNARYVLQRTEVEALERAGDELVLPSVVEPLRRAGQLSTVDGSETLAVHDEGRLSVEPTPGHTPGHQSVLVSGGGRRLVITGDVLVHAVQLVAPDVGYTSEADQDTARRTRRELLDEALRTPTWLATAHLHQPFFGLDR